MNIQNNFAYPHPGLFQAIHDFYGEINGPASFEPSMTWKAEHWSASVECSRGSILKKAGLCRLDIVNGMINESPGSLTLLQTLAYPENPRIPGFIIMTNTNETTAAGKVLVFYCDLFFQNAEGQEQAKRFFSEAMQAVCTGHGHDFMSYNQFLAGKRLLGNNTAEGGLLYFFEENDRVLLEELIRQALRAYGNIVRDGETDLPGKADFESMHRKRARLIEWINTDDYGVKVARENGIPLEVIEAYAFPPEICY